MASLTVTKESAKCLSGRDADRSVMTVPGDRGGKEARRLGDREGVAAHDDGDVMTPSRKVASFEVVQSEFALEVLVHPFGAPNAL
jgi:hypothetical protein